MALWSVRWQFDRQMLRGFLWHMRSASMSAIERTGDSEDMFCDLTSFSDVIRCMENCRIELNINLRVIRFIADNSITILILCLFCVCDERWRMNDRREANRQMTQHSIYSSCVMVNALWQLCIATSPLLNTQSPEVNMLRLFGEETAVVNRHSIWSRKFQRRLRVALL